MSALISDLAIILIVAGATTLLFKKLNQPLVLGYIVAGFLTSPNFSYLPTITNKENIETWAEIGVIFLMFALGLEFSFHKLKKVGSTAFIAAITAIIGMVIVGYATGMLLGWSHMDSIFLGGMLSMSSTAIIFKAFEEMGLKEEKFANLVLGALIIEDIAGIVMMVLLSTIATASANVSHMEILAGIAKLVFCLVLWFIVGMYFIPTFYKRYDQLFNDETLLIVSIGLCLGMVIIAEHAGFSSALGAFIMGSLITEAPKAERIEELIKPVKDLFAAVFFVSVGMLVDPSLLWQYIVPVIILILVTIVGQISCGTMGMLAAGQNLKNSILSGFCLCQLGEFSFILAALGGNLDVTSDFLYPIIVAVSVITTFTTPFCMKLAEPAYEFAVAHLPKRILKLVAHDNNDNVNDDNEWLDFLRSYSLNMLIFSVLLIAIGSAAKLYVLPHLLQLEIPYANYLTALATLFVMAPVLAKVLQGSTAGKYLNSLWYKRRANHLPIIALVLGKILLATLALHFVFTYLAGIRGYISFAAICITLYFLATSRWVISQYLHFESQFLVNLNEKHTHNHENGTCEHQDLLDQQLQIISYNILPSSPLIGKTLQELNFYQNYHCNIIRINSDSSDVFMPSGDAVLTKDSRFTIIGMPMDMEIFERAIKQENLELSVRFPQKSLREYMLDEKIPKKYRLYICALNIDDCPDLLGKSIHQTTLRSDYDCMIVAVERGSYVFNTPNANLVFEPKDLAWVIGQPQKIEKMLLEVTM